MSAAKIASTAKRTTARERLLAAADELFYAEGIHTVGIDRVIERAGVAKASLYSTFGSKEDLVRAYLEMRATRRRERITAAIAKHEHPREQLLAMFDVVGDLVAQPSFRGCAFVNASAEGNLACVRDVSAASRQWVHATFVRLCDALGVADPAVLGGELAIIYDGTIVGAAMDADPAIVTRARALAHQLLDAARKPRKK